MAKKNKTFLPKKIAGVRVPKKVRKGQFAEMLASKRSQALLIEALMAAGALAGAKKVTDSAKGGRALAGLTERMKSAGAGAGEHLGGTAEAVTYALGEAACTFAEALHQGRERHDERQDQPPRSGPPPELELKKKPRDPRMEAPTH